MIVTEFAKFAQGLKYTQLPAEVVTKAKTCVLDLLGVSVSAYGHVNAKLATRAALALGARGRARVWMTGERLRAIDAVLPNSVISHCILQDDWLQISHAHIGVAVIPTVLAMAEEHERSGKDVLTAIVAAYDVEDRAGLLSVPAFTRGFRPSALYSYFGATVAAARMMKLTRAQFESALGCAGSTCGGVLQSYTDSSMEWSFQEAFGSRAGILSAALAAQGLAGSRNVFEGPNGVNRSFSGTHEGSERALDGLGSHFHIMDTCFKRFATGGANHGSAAVALALRNRYHIDPRLIRRIHVVVPQGGTHERMNYVGIPHRGPFDTVAQCLLSKPFAIAAVLMTGSMTYDSVLKLQRNRTLEDLAKRIELEEAAGITGWNLKMDIELDDGTTLHGDGTDIDQSHLYLSWEAAVEKFRVHTRPKLGNRASEKIVELVGGLERLDDLGVLTKLLKPGK